MAATPYFSWRPHPWHGLETGPNPPEEINAYIEIDKVTGYLRVDRPQRTSSLPPALYGFIPRTYCGNEVSALSPSAERGDGDPLDVFVVSERPIERSEVILVARVVGAIRTVDGREADDKIIAVLANDNFWGEATSVSELPDTLISRLRHYLSTYKMLPGQQPKVEIAETVDRDGAMAIVEAAMLDYSRAYGQQ
jgi:inorganic pyrophosphatase